MIKELVNDPAILSQVCEPATADDAQVAQDLLDTLAAHDTAAGLAANQIGVTKCIIVYLDDSENPHVMFNPVLRQALNPFKAYESCLTIEGETKSTRFDRIQVVYDELYDGELTQRKERFSGFPAQVIQHLIDHCKGTLV